MATTLVVNPGSSSKKYAVYKDGKPVLEFCFERVDTGFEVCSRFAGTQQVCESVGQNDFADAFDRVAEEVRQYLDREVLGRRLDSVVVRIVAPGTFFQEHRVIDANFERQLQKHESAAPLHIPAIVKEIDQIKKQFRDIPIVAASDSAFHVSLPARAREYSLPVVEMDRFDIHRFGYHGLSVSSVVRRIHSLIGVDPERMIVCHIGSGTSVTAVLRGKSVDTSMGFSPSSGVLMGSRAGDIDSAALLELMRVKNLKRRDAELYINTHGGLFGMSGDADIRRLLDRRAQQDAVATQALETFAYQIQKTIAAQTVALGGLDALILTATAAVRSSELRTLVLSGVKHLGLQVGEDRNQQLVGKEGTINVRNNPIKIVVMRTDEMGEMAFVAEQTLSKSG